MKTCTPMLGLLLLITSAAMAAPESKTIAEVLREPLPSENLSCTVNDTTIVVKGPTFAYTVNRSSGVIAGLEAVRDGCDVVRLESPAEVLIDTFSMGQSGNGATRVVANTIDQVVLLTEAEWIPRVKYSVRSVFYNDGVVVSEITVTPEIPLPLAQGIRYEISNVRGRFSHYLHKRRDNEGMDCFKGTLPAAGETVLLNTPTSCLEVFSSEAALAMFTDMGTFYHSDPARPTAALRVDAPGPSGSGVGMSQWIVNVAPNTPAYALPAGKPFKFRVGLAVAPNRMPHPRWRDLRMFIWVGDDKFPYPTDDEILAAARLGFNLFQMHRLGPPGEPRPPAEELDRVIKTVHDAGMLFVWTANADLQYAHAKPVADLVAQGKWAQWQGFNYGGKYTAGMDPFCNTLATCLASPNGLADYRIECDKRMLDRYPVDGMYIDDNLGYANCTLSQEHGHPQTPYDCLIELHDMNWRRRQALMEKCPHAVLIDHSSQGFVLPIIAPFDAHLFGEGYTFPSVESFRATFGSYKNMYAAGSLFAGDSETTRCGAEVAYMFDLLTGGGQYCYLDWRLWPQKFPYAAGVNQYEPLFVKTYNLAQHYFGFYECGPVVELATTAPGTYGALYHNKVWNESLLVLANMNKTLATCSLASPDAPLQSLQPDAPIVAYDVHQRTASVLANGAAVTAVELQPFEMRLTYIRNAPAGAVYHQWGGKRISETWDAAARKLSLRISGPCGLEDDVVLGTGGNTIGQVTLNGQPAEFYADPATGLVYGKVIFARDPVLLQATALSGTLPQKSITPDELTTEYRP